ncbi:MAG: hypothetical protein U1E66_13570 [Rhodospirillales bacterium]
MHPMLLSLLAHISAHRRLLINAYACGLIEEPDPAEAARELQRTFAQSPTLAPPQGSGLDPATSDMVAAMTDEAINDFMDRVIAKIEQANGADADKGARPAPAETLLDQLIAGRRV